MIDIDKRALDHAHASAMKEIAVGSDAPLWVEFADAFGMAGKAGALTLQYLEAGIKAYLTEIESHDVDEHRFAEALRIVGQQANDGRLWFVATLITEDTLQKELRRLHAAIEGKTPEESARAAIAKATRED